MRTARKIYIIVLVILSFQTATVSAQSTSSPYSVFGLGFLEGNSAGPFMAMGGTGIGFLSEKSVNYMNPASYSGIDSLISVFEVGLFGKYTTFSTSRESQSLFNSNLKYILMGFRVTPWLATSFGFSPYSSIGYNINTLSTIEGTNSQYVKTFTGEGGVNQVYLGGSITPVKNLSLGFNAAYLFGNVTHAESSAFYSYYLEDITYISNFDFNYGLNYSVIADKMRFSLGLIYGSSKRLKTQNVTTIQTVNSTETLKKRSYKYDLPQNLGAGIAFTKGFFSAGFDFERSNWEDVQFKNAFIHTRNSNRYSLGIEFPSQGSKKGTTGMIFYRLGGEFRESYITIDNTPINYRALTMGVGIPLNNWISVVNVSVELGQNGTTRNGLFRENFINLHLDLSFKDFWFAQKRYN